MHRVRNTALRQGKLHPNSFIARGTYAPAASPPILPQARFQIREMVSPSHSSRSESSFGVLRLLVTTQKAAGTSIRDGREHGNSGGADGQPCPMEKVNRYPEESCGTLGIGSSPKILAYFPSDLMCVGEPSSLRILGKSFLEKRAHPPPFCPVP